MKRALIVMIAATIVMTACCSCTSGSSAKLESSSSEPVSSMASESHEVPEATDIARPVSAEHREIVCWGDSMTEGVGAGPAPIVKDGVFFDASYLSYPEILEQLTGVDTFNFGVSGATSEEIAFMQGAFEEDELLYGLGAVDDDVIEQGRQHTGDVLVLEIGSNGGWGEDYETLINQYREMIAHSGCDDYIIIGDTDDPGTSVADLNQGPFAEGEGAGETAWEAALREAFGEHFINMRVFLVEEGLEVAGLEATEEDVEDASRGCVSQQLRSDWTHLNSYGYFAQATAVYEKGRELGYW